MPVWSGLRKGEADSDVSSEDDDSPRLAGDIWRHRQKGQPQPPGLRSLQKLVNVR